MNNLTDLEKEAEEHWNSTYLMAKCEETKSYIMNDFIAGANSNYAKQQVIKGKIELLNELYKDYHSNISTSISCLNKIEIY